MTALLDLNLLAALLWPAHNHHAAAARWFHNRIGQNWATCALTQLGFLRLVSNPAFSKDSVTPATAIALLRDNTAHPHHEFWSEDLETATALAPMQKRLQGHLQLNDAYLLALASDRNGVLATLDRGIRGIAGDAFGSVVEVVPIP